MKKALWTKSDQVVYEKLNSKLDSFLNNLSDYKKEIEKITETEFSLEQIQALLINQEALKNYLSRISR